MSLNVLNLSLLNKSYKLPFKIFIIKIIIIIIIIKRVKPLGLLRLNLFVRNIGLVGPPELVASSRLLIYWVKGSVGLV